MSSISFSILLKALKAAWSATWSLGNAIRGHYNMGPPSRPSPNDSGVVGRLTGRCADFRRTAEDGNSGLFGISSWFPMLLLIGVWIFMRQMQGGTGKAMGFGKSRARMLTERRAG